MATYFTSIIRAVKAVSYLLVQVGETEDKDNSKEEVLEKEDIKVNHTNQRLQEDCLPKVVSFTIITRPKILPSVAYLLILINNVLELMRNRGHLLGSKLIYFQGL